MINLSDNILKDTIQKRKTISHKGDFGKTLLIGSNANFGGAILMAAKATLLSGSGLTYTATDPNNVTAIHQYLPEVIATNYKQTDQLITLIHHVNVIVIGPGLGNSWFSLALLKQIFNHVSEQQILIIDASAIDLIAKYDLNLPKAKTVLTPHQMEWQRLSGIKIVDQTPEANLKIVQQLHSVVVLKKHQTQIYTNQEIYNNLPGTPAMATGGSGDTLAGMIGGFTAQFNEKLNAILAATYLHTKIANDLAQTHYVVRPTQISENIPLYMQTIAQDN